MKKIEAIIRPEKVDPIRVALTELGIPSMTVTEVLGRGRQKGIAFQWRVGEYRVELLPKAKIEIVVLDEDVDKTVDVIISNAKTDAAGDGKIFVLPIEQVIRIRTQDKGESAI